MRDTSGLPTADAPQTNGRNRSASGPRLGMFWLCLAVGLAAVAALAWLFGLTWWSALIAALVIGCPVVIAWILLGGVNR